MISKYLFSFFIECLCKRFVLGVFYSNMFYKVFIHRVYCKVPIFSDTRKLRCYLLKIQTKRPNLKVFSQKVANGM